MIKCFIKPRMMSIRFQEITPATKDTRVPIYMFATVRKDESREATSNRCVSRCPLHAR